MGTKGKKKSKKSRNNEDKTNDYGDAADNLPTNNDGDHASLEELNNSFDKNIKGSKRKFIDNDDQESDESPKKIKKKKKPSQPEPTDKKGKKSIRQLKKEKHAQRQAEAEAAAKNQLKSQCISYLSQWKHDRQNWKFMKAKQVWLFKNKFSVNLVPDDSWPVFLEYFESAKGNIRNMLLEDSNKVIKQMDEWTETQEKVGDNDDQGEETSEVTKPDDKVYNRARSLIQCLGE